MGVTHAQDRQPRPEDSPVAWFVVLEDARRKSDYRRAERADRELRRLGVRVLYEPQHGTARAAG
jgi:hypothetical protein